MTDTDRAMRGVIAPSTTDTPQHFVRQRRIPEFRPVSMRARVMPTAEQVTALVQKRKGMFPEDAKASLLRKAVISALHEPRTVTELRELLLILLQEDVL